jgi:organic hydroperoxide reductase OsmC/OhrA
MARFARGWNLDLAGSRVTAMVGIGPARGGGFGPAAALDLHAPGIDRAKAVELMRHAHETCPIRDLPLFEGQPEETST